MASSTTHLSLEQYHATYAGHPGYEYWFGEVVRKAAPTWLHAILQGLLVELFVKAGYAAGSELDLRIDPDWEPRPDVVASLAIEEPYPTKPVDIISEVLSPDDRMDAVSEKCAQYARIGVGQIFVFNPRTHTAWEWGCKWEKSGASGPLEAGKRGGRRLSGTLGRVGAAPAAWPRRALIA